jgi:hypothetical protein
MSFLLLLDAEKPDCLDAILPLLPKYEELIEKADPLFNLAGQRLEVVARELPKHQTKYSKALKEIKGLVEWLNTVKDKRVAKVWKRFTEGYAAKLGPNDIKNYVGGDKEIIEINQIIIEVELIKQQLESVVSGFEQMGWMVAHITKLRVAELQEYIME